MLALTKRITKTKHGQKLCPAEVVPKFGKLIFKTFMNFRNVPLMGGSHDGWVKTEPKFICMALNKFDPQQRKILQLHSF